MVENSRRRRTSRSWDGVADWYVGWSGAEGSIHHRELAIPAVRALLALRRNERVIDLGCGPGGLARTLRGRGVHYTGVDSSRKLIRFARRHNGGDGVRFLCGDVTHVPIHPDVTAASFDAAVFLLSLQDIDPLARAIAAAAWALRPGGRLVVLMTHPCFRVPRQSGWGWDSRRKLHYRRVDRYLTVLDVPMQPHSDGRGTTRSFHRPLSAYVDALAGAGFLIDALREMPAPVRIAPSDRAGNADIPLFMGIRAILRYARF
jgi:SAM-dependent methyltransferase